MSATLGVPQPAGAGVKDGRSPAQKARDFRLAQEQQAREKENQPQQHLRTGSVQPGVDKEKVAANRAAAMARLEQNKRLKVSQEGAAAAGAA